jgi:hypothetical protein
MMLCRSFSSAAVFFRGVEQNKKPPDARPGGYEPDDAGLVHATLRFSAEVLPRFVTSSYSTDWPSLSVRKPARSTAEM